VKPVQLQGPSDADLLGTPLQALLAKAAALRDFGHGNIQSYSRKVFIPLTHLCRDVCHYCTFAKPPRRGTPVYLGKDEILRIARAGAAAGCTEALFTLGEKPERRYHAAREALDALGYATTIEYLAAMCRMVVEETGLLPHANPGTLDADELALLRKHSVSQGMMLESASDRLSLRGGPHYGSPDKRPAVRLKTIALAGEAKIPFTTGLLIGIGETREERLQAMHALQDLQQRYGHIQEIIIQNFKAKPDTRMAAAPEPAFEELLWTIACARIIFGSEMNIQAPPNLSGAEYPELIGAGINDWGGISPVTIDHVNPEAPWPHLKVLADETAKAGKILVQRLPVYPRFLEQRAKWLDPALHIPTLRASDSDGFARADNWTAGSQSSAPAPMAFSKTVFSKTSHGSQLGAVLRAAENGDRLREHDIVRLFAARGPDFDEVCASADALRQRVNGDTVSYVVNRNINYTNMCGYHCRFCAFSKGKLSRDLRGPAYDLDLEEVARRTEEAWSRGATEVCMQGGIHPDYTGDTYLALCRAVKDAVPGMHIHAFSPLEVRHGAGTLGLPLTAYLERLREAGLASLPGTAAEILDDEVRAELCPDKLNTAEWLEVMDAAHAVGLRTTATIMFGHIERPVHWARHLLHIRDLQVRTGGFTEFVPLPFVHMEAPIFHKWGARMGPTYREVILMHAVSRLVLNPVISNIQVSWVKLGEDGARQCLASGANDLGGTLMNESISRAAGAAHGQELAPERMEALIASAGRVPRLRTTLYADALPSRRARAFGAAELTPIVLTTPRRREKPIRAAAE
jgi:FO synthase